MSLPAALAAGAIPYFVQEIDGRHAITTAAFAGLVSGSFHPLHRGHLQLLNLLRERVPGRVALELTLTNADKPMLSLPELHARLARCEGSATVVVTRASTFAEKARLFPRTGFGVGYDTALRILDPRFYADMGAALAEIRAAGCRFLVAGRCDPAGRYHPATDLPVRPEWADLFEPIPECDFRADVSATDLRRNIRA